MSSARAAGNRWSRKAVTSAVLLTSAAAAVVRTAPRRPLDLVRPHHLAPGGVRKTGPLGTAPTPAPAAAYAGLFQTLTEGSAERAATPVETANI
ncbi:hypothetical protein ABZ712_12350 [Streptomyces sp. NPDC006906]|uniref:hypothetical protein n=1 Tax=unclassified Streptomyces TaxID=2593676 RepID=UPI0033CBD3E0